MNSLALNPCAAAVALSALDVWTSITMYCVDVTLPLKTHLHLNQAGGFYDAVTYVREAFVPRRATDSSRVDENRDI